MVVGSLGGGGGLSGVGGRALATDTLVSGRLGVGSSAFLGSGFSGFSFGFSSEGFGSRP